MAAVRRQVYADLGENFEQSWDHALTIMHRMAGEPDFGEGIASFTEKRAPEFEALPDEFAEWLDSLSGDGRVDRG